MDKDPLIKNEEKKESQPKPLNESARGSINVSTKISREAVGRGIEVGRVRHWPR